MHVVFVSLVYIKIKDLGLMGVVFSAKPKRIHRFARNDHSSYGHNILRLVKWSEPVRAHQPSNKGVL
jgi:hypothetical protein